MKRPDRKFSRRNFLLSVGAGGAAASAAIIAGKSPQVEPAKTKVAAGSRGYQVTAHVLKYYDTTKV